MTTCYEELNVIMARVCRLNSNGSPKAGVGNLYVTESIVSLTMAIQIKAGASHEAPNGNGRLCFSYDEPDIIKGLNLQSAWCQDDPELRAMLSGGDLITTGGVTTGYAAPKVGTSPDTDGCSLEIWTYNIEGSDIDPDVPYVRFVFGKTTWTPADTTFANGPITHPYTGKAKENKNFLDGPANDWPYTSDRLWQYNGDTELPESMCGAQELIAS